MNPLTLTARHQRVDAEVRRIREAWPTARVTRSADRLAAVAVIDNAHSTYIIEVDPDSSRSLWVSFSLGGGGHTAGWRDGWVD